MQCSAWTPPAKASYFPAAPTGSNANRLCCSCFDSQHCRCVSRAIPSITPDSCTFYPGLCERGTRPLVRVFTRLKATLTGFPASSAVEATCDLLYACGCFTCRRYHLLPQSTNQGPLPAVPVVFSGSWDTSVRMWNHRTQKIMMSFRFCNDY